MRSSARRETEAQGPVAPPRDGDVEFGEPGVDKHRSVGPQRQVHSHVVLVDHDRAGGVDEVAPDAVWGGELVAGQAACQQSVTVARHDRQCGIQVHVEG